MTALLEYLGLISTMWITNKMITLHVFLVWKASIAMDYAEIATIATKAHIYIVKIIKRLLIIMKHDPSISYDTALTLKYALLHSKHVNHLPVNIQGSVLCGPRSRRATPVSN